MLNWISVNKDLPPAEMPVLVRSHDGDYYVAWIKENASEIHWMYSHCCGCQCHDIKEWCDLSDEN